MLSPKSRSLRQDLPESDVARYLHAWSNQMTKLVYLLVLLGCLFVAPFESAPVGCCFIWIFNRTRVSISVTRSFARLRFRDRVNPTSRRWESCWPIGTTRNCMIIGRRWLRYPAITVNTDWKPSQGT